MSDVPPRTRAAGRWAGYGSFVAWTAIGAGVCVAWLSPLTIALAVLVAVVVGVLLVVGGVVLVAAGALLFRQAVRGRDEPDQGASAVGAGPVAPGASPG